LLVAFFRYGYRFLRTGIMVAFLLFVIQMACMAVWPVVTSNAGLPE